MKDNVEAADAVGRDQYQIISDVVYLEYFAFLYGLEFSHVVLLCVICAFSPLG